MKQLIVQVSRGEKGMMRRSAKNRAKRALEAASR
jgi:hypothetical protein